MRHCWLAECRCALVAGTRGAAAFRGRLPSSHAATRRRRAGPLRAIQACGLYEILMRNRNTSIRIWRAGPRWPALAGAHSTFDCPRARPPGRPAPPGPAPHGAAARPRGPAGYLTHHDYAPYFLCGADRARPGRAAPPSQPPLSLRRPSPSPSLAGPNHNRSGAVGRRGGALAWQCLAARTGGPACPPLGPRPSGHPGPQSMRASL